MSVPQNIDKAIFLYLSGEADLEEIQELRNWLNSDPHNKEVFENMARFWKNSEIDIAAKNKDEAFSLLISRLKHHQNSNVRYLKSYSPHKKKTWKSLGKIAAAVVLLLASAVAVKLGIGDNTTETTIPKKVATVHKQNLIGQKSTIRLPDGSTVWLNAESSVSFPEYFDSTERRIALTGEAFFDIQKDENRPFIVETADMNVSVLGTRFNVKAFPGETMAKVSLVSGKVKVDKYISDSHYESFVLEPGEEIKYNEQNGKIEKQKFDIEEVTAWKDGILILNNDSFTSFAKKLKRWYGVEVKVEGKPGGNFIIKGKFQNENLENVLRTLQFSRDFEFTIEDKLLTIKFKNM